MCLDEDVVVVDYNPAWPMIFSREQRRICSALDVSEADLEHIGSTAVPELAAKPVVDLMLGVEAYPPGHEVLSVLAGLGYGNGASKRRNVSVKWIEFSTLTRRRPGLIRQYLLHERLIVRFATLFGLGLVALYASWALAYALLPEAVLRGKSAAAVLAGDAPAGSLLAEFARIAALNLIAATIFVALPNRLLHVNEYPLGYLPPLLWSIYYGVLLGSNSFSITMPERLAPSLDVFSRSGVYEIAAYCLVAASTHAIAVSRSPSLFSLASEPVEPRARLLEGIDKRGIALAMVVLLASNMWEAYRILTAA